MQKALKKDTLNKKKHPKKEADMATKNTNQTCAVCKKKFDEENLFPVALLRNATYQLIKKDRPALSKEDVICLDDIKNYHALTIKETLIAQKKRLTPSEDRIIHSLSHNHTIARNIAKEYETSTTFGNRVADRVVSFGGSWKFLIGFFVFLSLWLAINSYWLFSDQPFDPYPYILLNLVLSCLAAIQAPLIMMSQNRQEAKDRLRAEHDYEVNLKAEIEIRQLNNKIDHYIKTQWQDFKTFKLSHQDLLTLMKKGKKKVKK
jgi:uncharacterized membrane protein